MKYQISYQKNGVFQCIQVNAQTETAAVAYFKEYKPSAEYIGISTTCDNKPGMPCITVPDGWEAPGRTQEEPRKNPGRTQEEPRKNPGRTQHLRPHDRRTGSQKRPQRMEPGR